MDEEVAVVDNRVIHRELAGYVKGEADDEGNGGSEEVVQGIVDHRVLYNDGHNSYKIDSNYQIPPE